VVVVVVQLRSKLALKLVQQLGLSKLIAFSSVYVFVNFAVN